jgi:hypothetical protein
VDFLSSHDLHRAHGRHLHRQELAAHGLKISELESDPALQDAVLTVHHACMLTVGNRGTNKLIENQDGVTHAKVLHVGVQMPIQIPLPQPAPWLTARPLSRSLWLPRLASWVLHGLTSAPPKVNAIGRPFLHNGRGWWGTTGGITC